MAVGEIMHRRGSESPHAFASPWNRLLCPKQAQPASQPSCCRTRGRESLVTCTSTVILARTPRSCSAMTMTKVRRLIFSVLSQTGWHVYASSSLAWLDHSLAGSLAGWPGDPTIPSVSLVRLFSLTISGAGGDVYTWYIWLLGVEHPSQARVGRADQTNKLDAPYTLSAGSRNRKPSGFRNRLCPFLRAPQAGSGCGQSWHRLG